MGLVATTCAKCGASITVDSDKERAVCQFCGTSFITENVVTQSINNEFNSTTNNTNRSGNDIVNVYADEINRLFIIENGELTKYNGSASHVIIPSNVTKLGNDIFNTANCKKVNTAIKKITLPEGITEIGDGFCLGLKNLAEINIPSSVTVIGENAFDWCSKLDNIVLPENLKSIGRCAFRGCENLQNIIIPDSVIHIGLSAFSGCTLLSSVEIGSSLLSIETYTFYDCSSLTSVTIPSSVRIIEKGAFANCPVLKKPKINKKTTYVEKKAFTRSAKEGCYVATSVYGSYDCKEVWVLRRYRDYHLDKSFVGKIFIKIYYAISPTLVKAFGNTKIFKSVCKNILDKKVQKLQQKGYKNTKYNDKY